ncbi:methylsterol monooxygenase 1-like isoform X2 [Stegodyphus dumicola]|uniref:methylsterol monooxygenase 1-like isoform X2 n=1 Tax=Stegodyphus dumicola TaxID=202533 RepID=UPI0015B28CC7|nr:methylsterol monooxygenase 1-like isoform X2 [Stegodyphus dumicola]
MTPNNGFAKKRTTLRKNVREIFHFIPTDSVFFFLEKLWSRLHPTAGKCLAIVLILFAGIAMQGNWLLILSSFVRRFYEYPKEEGQESLFKLISQLQSRFRGLPYYILTSVTQSSIFYFGLCGFLQWYFYVRQRDRPEEWKCQPKKFLSWEDEKHGILLGTACMLTEALFYYYHRIFHWPAIYKTYHKVHHRYKQPTAFSATAMHPLEFFVLQTVTFIPMFTIPIHYAVFIGVVFYENYYSVIGHSGAKIKSLWPWQPDSMYHDNHHEFFHVNFGLNTKLFDYLHGTLRKEDHIYSENIFYGYGKKWSEATEEEKQEFLRDHKD